MQRKILDEIRNFTFELRYAKNKETSHVQEAIDKEFSLNNYSQISVLQYLIENKDKEICQKDIEKALAMNKVTLSGIIDSLEKKNLVERRTSDKDKRIRHVYLTDKAKEKFINIHGLMNDVNENIIEGIDKDRLDVFYEVLDQMRNNLHKGEVNEKEKV